MCSKYELEDRRIRRTTITGISSSKTQVDETKVINEAILKNYFHEGLYAVRILYIIDMLNWIEQISLSTLLIYWM